MLIVRAHRHLWRSGVGRNRSSSWTIATCFGHDYRSGSVPDWYHSDRNSLAYTDLLGSDILCNNGDQLGHGM